MAERVFWGIHAKGPRVEDVLLSRRQLAIGWPNLGDITAIAHDRDLIKQRLKTAWLGAKPGAIPVVAGEIFRFANDLAEGDVVLFRSASTGQIHFGEVVGPYTFDPADDPDHPNRRAVKWTKTVPITDASLGALHELGSALTFFQVKNYADEWAQVLAGAQPVGLDDSDEVVAFVAEASEQTTRDFILKRLAAELKGHPFAHFVANLLQTMGYRTTVSPQGPDGGIDIVAHRGELGFEPPIVRVQVKSTEGSIGGPTVAELLGNLGSGEYGLIVTLGSFTSQAKAKVKPHIRLIGGDELVKLILDHYESLDTRYKSVIPVQRMYVPQPLPDG